MPVTKIKLSREVKMVVLEYKNRIGNRPALVSEDLQKALLATCVMSELIKRASYAPDQTIRDYADLYFEAKVALMLNSGDIETERLVAEKYGI